MLIVALVHSRLDYGNAVLVGIPAYLVRRLQSVLSEATRLTYHLRPYFGDTALAARPKTHAVKNRDANVQCASGRDIWDLLSPSLTCPVGKLCGQQVPAA